MAITGSPPRAFRVKSPSKHKSYQLILVAVFCAVCIGGFIGGLSFLSGRAVPITQDALAGLIVAVLLPTGILVGFIVYTACIWYSISSSGTHPMRDAGDEVELGGRGGGGGGRRGGDTTMMPAAVAGPQRRHDGGPQGDDHLPPHKELEQFRRSQGGNVGLIPGVNHTRNPQNLYASLCHIELPPQAHGTPVPATLYFPLSGLRGTESTGTRDSAIVMSDASTSNCTGDHGGSGTSPHLSPLTKETTKETKRSPDANNTKSDDKPKRQASENSNDSRRASFVSAVSTTTAPSTLAARSSGGSSSAQSIETDLTGLFVASDEWVVVPKHTAGLTKDYERRLTA